MTNYQKFGFIVGQIFMGLGFALLGGIFTLILIYLGQGTQMMSLYGEIMYALIGCYVGMQVGIGFDGFMYLKQYGKQKDFSRFFLQSVLGLMLGLVISYMIVIPVGNSIPHWLTNFLMITAPLVGAVIGFDYKLTKLIDASEKRDTDL